MVRRLEPDAQQLRNRMVTQREKAERFRDLHEREGAFVIPNPWDAGSARLLEGMGFEALATTSAVWL